MSNLNGPSWDEATRDERIAEGAAQASPTLEKARSAGDTLRIDLGINLNISPEKWQLAENAFYENTEVRSNGSISALRAGISAAILVILS